MGLFSGKKNRPEGVTLSPDTTAGRIALTPETLSAAAGPRRLLSYRVANLQGIGTRQGQEDSFSFANASDVNQIREKGLLAIVADGMGGMKDGKLASETTVDSIRATFDTFDYSADLSQQLCNALRVASDRVYGILKGMGGSTAVVCLFYDGYLYYASAGDSFLYLLHRGQLTRVNRLHTVFHEECASLIARGSFDPSGPSENPEKKALSMFVGIDELSDVDCFRIPLKLEGEDVLLLCSDGVGDVLSEQEIRESLSLSSPRTMCVALEQLIFSKARKYQDNYTALVIKCEY